MTSPKPASALIARLMSLRRYRLVRIRLHPVKQTPSKKKPARPRTPYWYTVPCALYLAALCVLAYCNAVGPEQWRWVALNLYIPQWSWMIPGAILLVIGIVFARKMAWLPLLGCLWVAYSPMGFHWPLAISDNNGVRIRVMTYNVQGLRYSSAVAAEILKQKPDLLLLQEAGSLQGLTKSILKDWHIAGPFGEIVIASRYPFDRVAGLSLPPMNNKPCYIRCELTVSGRRFVVYSVHLPTPRHGLTALMEKGEEGSDDWRHNINARMSYSALVSARVRNDIGPRLIGGDLNAPSPSLVVRMLEGNTLTDAFEQAGKGYGYTYGHALRFKHSYIRIDHLLASPEWHAKACWVGGADGSDHRPVIADYILE